jgi:DNA-binding MarR family transcriptional regulator
VAIFLDEMATLELTPVQYGALMIVAAKPNIDQSTLATELGVDRANAGDVLARMSKAGYVTRTPSPNDRRFIQINLTAEGTALLRKASARAKKVQDRLLKPLAPSDRDVFIALITQIINGNDHLSRAPLRSGQIARARQVSTDA